MENSFDLCTWSESSAATKLKLLVKLEAEILALGLGDLAKQKSLEVLGTDSWDLYIDEASLDEYYEIMSAIVRKCDQRKRYI